MRAISLRGQVDWLHGHRIGCQRTRDWFGPRKSVGRRRSRPCRLLEADLNLPIPFDGSSFDAAISLDVVVHLRNRKALFHEMARLLVPTGRLLLTDAGVITGPISNEEIERRSVNGYMQFVPPGVNEKLLEAVVFGLLIKRTEQAALSSTRAED